MLKVMLDDPAARRLVLRADAWGVADVARRALATALSLVAIAVALWIAIAHGWAHALWTVPVALGLASWWMTAPPEDTAEIDVDGRSRTIRVRRRGVLCWQSRLAVVALEEDARLVRLRGGLVAPGGIERPELGLELWEGEWDDRPLRALAPRFAVDGIDRRDDAQQLAETIARRLGLRIAIERDTISELRVLVSHRGDEPPSAARVAGAYRSAAAEAALRLRRPPSFEEPRSPPVPIPAHETGALVEELRCADGALRVVGRWRRKPWRAGLWIGVGIAGAGAVGAVVGAFTGDVLGGLYVGLGFALLLLAVAMTVLTTIGTVGGLVSSTITLLDRALRGFARTTPGGWLAVKPREWTLRDGALEVRLLAGYTRKYGRGDVRAVVVASAHRQVGKKGWRAWRELWARTPREWIRLARSTPVDGYSAPPAPLLEAVAVEVARVLDAPVRGAGDR